MRPSSLTVHIKLSGAVFNHLALEISEGVRAEPPLQTAPRMSHHSKGSCLREPEPPLMRWAFCTQDFSSLFLLLSFLHEILFLVFISLSHPPAQQNSLREERRHASSFLLLGRAER